MTRLFLALFVLTGALSAQTQPAKEYSLHTTEPDEIDRAALGHTRYDFRIDSKDGLVDSSGKAVAAANLGTYLKTREFKADAFYFLWITPTSAPTDTLAPTLKSLSDHGITKIVVRYEPRPRITNNKTVEPVKGLEKSLANLRTEKKN
ncbi:hypothetical protein [Oleiharenicola lentus]|uniref:hypothetical protein n=1 Tax=Oleiharenicola lentus TaxID=2508720 RepID=UPI003F67B67C